MPVFRYAPLSPPCKLCGEGFDLVQPAAAPALAACPTCGQPVQRAVATRANLPKLTAPLSVSQVKQAGFTVLRRTGDGTYEKS